MHRLMRPDTVSVFSVRQAISRPRPSNAATPARMTTTSASGLPLMRHAEAQAADQQQQRHLGNQKDEPRDQAWTARKSLRRIGVASNRLNSLRTRMSTMTKPTPNRPPPIRFMPIRPGSRKSM